MEITISSNSSKSVEHRTSLAQWGYLIASLPFLVLALIQVSQGCKLLLLHNDNTYPEASCVYAFLSTFHSGHLYGVPLAFPWNVQMYGPVFYLLGGATAAVSGGAPFATTVLSRLIELFSFLASVGIIARLALKLERSFVSTVLVALIGLACTWAWGVAVSARPDMLAVFWFFCAAYIYIAGESNVRNAVLVGALLSASLLTKQSAAPLVLCFLADCALNRQFRRGISIVLAMMFFAALILVPLMLSHEPYAQNLLAVSQAVWSWSSVPRSLMDLMRTSQISLLPLVLAAVGAIYAGRQSRYQFLTILIPCAWIVNVAALANVGGAANYLILPYLLCLLYIPPALKVLERSARFKSYILAGIGFLALGILYHQRNLIYRPTPDDLRTDSLQQFTLLTDRPYLEMYSRQPQLLDPYYFHQLELNGYWKPTAIVDGLEGEKYDLVLFSGSDAANASDFDVEEFRGIAFWGPKVIYALRAHYDSLCSVESKNTRYFAFVPSHATRSVSFDTISSIFGSPCHASIRQPAIPPSAR